MADPTHIDLFSEAFAKRWRQHAEHNSAAWLATHASLTGRWAEYRAGLP